MRLLSLLLAMFLVPSAWGGLDPESSTPYRLRIVLHLADHHSFTPRFQAELRKDLQANLQAALGTAGTVEVATLEEIPADKREAVIKRVQEKGLEALDSFNAVSNAGKTHFVWIQGERGQYTIQSRQFDATTGFATPIIRRYTTADRNFLSRVASLAVGEDFGVVGTFERNNGERIPVTLKAGKLGLGDRWVKKGDIFAAVQIQKPRGRPAKGEETPIGTRVDGVLLQVIEEPKEGIALCKPFSRYKEPFTADPSVLGYRCLKLGTGEDKLRLKITDPNGTPYKSDLIQLRANGSAFPDLPREREEMLFHEGAYVSKEAFKNMAFVLVKSADQPVARIPVEVYADQVAIKKVNLKAKGDDQEYGVTLVRDLLDRIRNSRVVQLNTIDQITDLQKKDKPKALEYAAAAVQSQSKDAVALRADLTRLRERFPQEKERLQACDSDIFTFEQKIQLLRSHQEDLRKVIALENDPATMAKQKAINALLLEAKSLIEKADYEPAIAKYEEALSQAGDLATAKAEIEKSLSERRGEWEIKSPEQAEARKFVYETWIKVENPADFQSKLPELKKAIDACKSAGDKVTLRKIVVTAPQITERVVENYKKQIDMATTDEEKQALKKFENLAEEFRLTLASIPKG